MSRDWLRSLVARERVGDSVWVWYLGIGTVPVGVFGLLLTAVGSEFLRTPAVIAGATIFFAILLWWSDRFHRGTRGDGEIGWRDVLIIGAAQALALIPGTSRSGITITAGLALGILMRLTIMATQRSRSRQGFEAITVSSPISRRRPRTRATWP